MRNTTFHPNFLWQTIEDKFSWLNSSLKSYWLPVIGLVVLAVIAALTLGPRVIRDRPITHLSNSKPLTREDLARVSDLFRVQRTAVPFYELNRPSVMWEAKHD